MPRINQNPLLEILMQSRSFWNHGNSCCRITLEHISHNVVYFITDLSITSSIRYDELIPWISTLRPRRNKQHFADDIFKRIFFNENVWISIKISLKFVPKGPINNIPALVQIMAWRRSGDKPLSEPMMVSLSTHICVTRPQWVNKIYSVLVLNKK